MLTGGAAGTVREEFLRMARDIATVRGEPDAWLPPELGTLLIVGGPRDLLTWWLRQLNPMPIKRIVEIHECVVVNPVLRGKDPKTPRKSKP